MAVPGTCVTAVMNLRILLSDCSFTSSVLDPGLETFHKIFDACLFVVLMHKPTTYKWIPSVHAGIVVQGICPVFWLAGRAVWSARRTSFERLIVPSYSCP